MTTATPRTSRMNRWHWAARSLALVVILASRVPEQAAAQAPTSPASQVLTPPASQTPKTSTGRIPRPPPLDSLRANAGPGDPAIGTRVQQLVNAYQAGTLAAA